MPETVTRSQCPYCGVGCGVLIRSKGDRIIGVKGDPKHPANKGLLCSKGLELHETVHLPNRLLHPEMREKKDAARRRVPWPEAVGRLASTLRHAVDSGQPDRVGFYISGQLLTEDYYAFNKLAKGFVGTNNIDSNSRLCMSSAVVGYKRAFGVDGPPTCYEDMDLAQLHFVVGSNMAWCHPILFRRMEKARAANGSKLIVVDPRRTATAEMADLHLAIRPGSDAVLLNGLLAELIRRGAVDADYIASHTTGFDALREFVSPITAARVCQDCGISAGAFAALVEAWQSSPTTLSYWAMGINQSRTGSDDSSAIINLHLATGRVGKPGAGPFSLTGQPNAMGGRDVGAMANLLGGHRDLASETDRREVEAIWNSGPIPAKPGLTAVEMFERAADGAMDVLWIACTNPAVSMPNQTVVRAALQRTPLVAVQDIFGDTSTAAFADILLPAAGWGEKAGTMTNSERCITRIDRAVSAPGEARPDWQIVCDVAAAMGLGERFAFAGPEAIFDEHRRVQAGRDNDISGIGYDRLADSPLAWPCKTETESGQARLYTDGRFQTPDGRARFIVPSEKSLALATVKREAGGMVMTTGRLRDQWHTRTKTGRVPELNQHVGEPWLDVSSADAAAMGVASGDRVDVRSGEGRFQSRVRVDATLPSGLVFAPMHWDESSKGYGLGNHATSSLFDPTSKQPELKWSAVSLHPVRSVVGRVVIVGSGKAGSLLAGSLRQRDPGCDLVLIESNADVASLEPAIKQISLSDGRQLDYDHLVLALESRPVPPPFEHSGIFTISGPDEIGQVASRLNPGDPVWLMGTGKCALETAATLAQRGCRVSLSGPTSLPLMDRLDSAAARMVSRHLAAMEVRYHPNCEPGIEAEGDGLTVTDANGVSHAVRAVILATEPTRPLELARKAGLRCGTGIVVDEYLRASQPGILAIGEAAEFEGRCHGMPSVLERQAATLAAALTGDLSLPFHNEEEIFHVRLEAMDIRLCGDLGVAEDPETEELVQSDTARGVHRRILLNRDRIVGYTLLGAYPGLAGLDRRYRSRLRVKADRELLLSGMFKPDAMEPQGPVVCACCSVTTGAIIASIIEGADDLKKVGKACHAGTRCGSCKPEIQVMLRSVGSSNP